MSACPSEQGVTQHVRLPATMAGVDTVTRHVVALGARAGLGPDRCYRLRLAAEEIATNVVVHGHRGRAGATFDLETGCDGNRVWVRLVDDARPFDPTAAPRPDLDVPLRDRAVGGLGIHLTRSSVDEFGYERCAGHNRVTLTLRREPAAGQGARRGEDHDAPADSPDHR